MDNPTVQTSFFKSEEHEPVLKSQEIVKNYNSTTSEMTSSNEVEEAAAVVEGTAAAAVQEKRTFPKHVFLIVLSEFCERFSYYGLRTVLIIYFTQFILISENQATAYFHAFTMLCYFTPIFGAIIADGWIGKFKTILWISIVYLIGEIILCVTAMKPLGAPNLPGPLIGLLLIGFGTGGIKPCVSAFGGDQFTTGDKRHLETFFSMFYLSINVGAFFGSIITPILRSDVKCFDDNCYPLAFGVPAALMLIALVFFVLGKPLYTLGKVNREDNVFKKLFGCVCYAMKMRFKNGRSKDKDAHWLDNAQDKYDKQFITDVKAFCRVAFMFLPVPVFWALFDQQGSRWTLQAQKLDSHLAANFYLKADQIQAINPVLILILIPTFNWVVYPLFAKCKILSKPLQRMSVGMLLACVAFIASALLEYKIQESFISVNSKPNQIQVINVAPFDLEFNATSGYSVIMPSNRLFYEKRGDEKYTISYGDRSNVLSYNLRSSNNKYLKNNYVFYADNQDLKVINVVSSIESEPIGKSQLRLYYLNTTEDSSNYEATIETLSKAYTASIKIFGVIGTISKPATSYKDIDFDEYELTIRRKGDKNATFSSKYRLDNGARYTLVLYRNDDKLSLVQIVDVTGNQVHFAWQLIQYLIITCAEIMFSISGLAFAYSQAPESMKSLLQAVWLLTVAFGNLIVFVIAEVDVIKNQVYEYVLFAGLILVSAIVFGIMSCFYVYVDGTDNSGASTKEEKDGKRLIDKLKFTQSKSPRNSTASDVQLVRISNLELN